MKPADAYGEYNTGLVTTIPRSVFQDVNIVPKVGDVYNRNGRFTVLELTNETVTVDYNSKMAGKVLVFDITLEAIDEPQTPTITPQTNDDEEKNTDEDATTNTTEPTSNSEQTGAREPANNPEPTGQE